MSNKGRIDGSGISDEQGQALVEFALIAPVLVLFLYAIIQFGFLFYGFITVEQAARLGVRSASLGEGSTVVGQAIDQQISGIGMSASASAAASYTPPAPFAPTSYRLVWEGYSAISGSTPTVVVGVIYRYPIIIPFLGSHDFEIRQQYTMPQEDPPSSTFANASQSAPALFYGPAS